MTEFRTRTPLTADLAAGDGLSMRAAVEIQVLRQALIIALMELRQLRGDGLQARGIIDFIEEALNREAQHEN
tara:strand:+ start:1852 stop:2067 length:216 start_codon:yes stop_codon:yes gene_type:complete